MAGLCTWIAEREDRLVAFTPPVIAGVAHYALTDIHPSPTATVAPPRAGRSPTVRAHLDFA